MKKELLYSLPSLYREEMKIYGYQFGQGKKSVCIVGAMRGNEIQQMYICSQLVDTLKELEEKGALVEGYEIMVIPSVNLYSMNIGKRFWASDNTDINRMFPGYDKGETTQRVADGLFQVVQEYEYGLQFTSFYIPGDFVPHVRMMDTGIQNPSMAEMFGLPYAVIRTPRPYDTTTLNYNWQIWNTHAFSIYTGSPDRVDQEEAAAGISAVLRFLIRLGIVRYTIHQGSIASLIREQELENVRTDCPGICCRMAEPGQEIHQGQLLAVITDPCEGKIVSQIYSPTDGIVFFACASALVMEGTMVYRIIRYLHV